MPKSKMFIKIHKKHVLTLIVSVGILLTPVIIIVTILTNYYLKIYPGVFVNEVNLSGKTLPQAQEILETRYGSPKEIQLSIQTLDGLKSTTLTQEKVTISPDINSAISAAYEHGRTGNLFSDLGDILLSAKNPLKIPITLSIDKTSLADYLHGLDGEILTPPSFPRFLLKSGDVVIVEGSLGEELPEEYVINQLSDAFQKQYSPVILATKRVDTTLTDPERELALERGRKLLDKSLTITVGQDVVQTLRADKLLPLLNAKGGYANEQVNALVETLTKEINHEVVEPIFAFENERVKEFAPGTTGIAVQQKDFRTDLLQKLSNLETQEGPNIALDVPHKTVEPTTHISDVNNLGIKELLGKGTSKFSGSIPSRIFNVALASSRINGVLVPPGETFSFAKAIGDVSKFTGYKEAYIIQGGRTVLGDGGGVCQVSTTLFRAVMSAGLPIIERHAHAYRVGYYEQDGGPGLDATVYVPSVDFKFKNDTAHYILVQTSVDTKKLTADFRIYGTSDGRVSHVTKPVVSNQIPPPEDQYLDDPTLPLGKVNQVEHKAWGARVTFNYTVTKGDETVYEKSFTSVYQPWKAVYMRGTGPAQ